MLLIAILSGGAYFYYDREIAPCRDPIAYDVGSFDSRFGITKERFLTTITEAETVWEINSKHNLFSYEPGSKFKINLIFDERQERTIDATRSKEEIEYSRSQYDSLLAQYKSLSSRYELDLNAYNLRVDSFESRLDSYNAKVAQANTKGGATPQEFKQLESERKSLELEKSSLDRERISLNGKASELNSLGDEVNRIAKELNIEVDLHNNRFGEAKEFDQGDYQGNRINVYQFDGIGDLRLVIAHEFGHALGIDHVENPRSIMYYLMEKQDIQNPDLSLEDLIALNDACNF